MPDKTIQSLKQQAKVELKILFNHHLGRETQNEIHAAADQFIFKSSKLLQEGKVSYSTLEKEIQSALNHFDNTQSPKNYSFDNQMEYISYEALYTNRKADLYAFLKKYADEVFTLYFSNHPDEEIKFQAVLKSRNLELLKEINLDQSSSWHDTAKSFLNKCSLLDSSPFARIEQMNFLKEEAINEYKKKFIGASTADLETKLTGFISRMSSDYQSYDKERAIIQEISPIIYNNRYKQTRENEQRIAAMEATVERLALAYSTNLVFKKAAVNQTNFILNALTTIVNFFNQAIFGRAFFAATLNAKQNKLEGNYSSSQNFKPQGVFMNNTFNQQPPARTYEVACHS